MKRYFLKKVFSIFLPSRTRKIQNETGNVSSDCFRIEILVEGKLVTCHHFFWCFSWSYHWYPFEDSGFGSSNNILHWISWRTLHAAFEIDDFALNYCFPDYRYVEFQSSVCRVFRIFIFATRKIILKIVYKNEKKKFCLQQK